MRKFLRVVVIYSPKSTRFNKYDTEVKPEILRFADENNCKFIEIPVVDLPYFTARDTIGKDLRNGDLVIATGGDGVTNVTLDAAMASNRDLTFATLPLGNVNDFASSINGRIRDITKILHGSTTKFHPLDLSINNEHLLFSGQYISFGATTILVDWLNSPSVRAARKKYRGNVALLMLYGARNIGKVSKAIATAELPVHANYNSFGFFIGKTGKFFKLRHTAELHRKSDKFLFHCDSFRGKIISDAMKFTNWLLRGIPGKISDYEKLEFPRPIDSICQVGGDNIPLQNVSEISCTRSKRSIRILVPR